MPGRARVLRGGMAGPCPRQRSAAGCGWLALLAVLWSSGCSLFQADLVPPQVTVRSLAIEALALDRQTFRVRVRLANPNSVALKLRSAEAFLELDGVRVGQGQLAEPVAIAAGASQEVDVRVTTDLAAQGPRLLQWLLAGNSELAYRVSGFVELGQFGLGRLELDDRGRVSLADLVRMGRRQGNVSAL